MKRLGVCFFGLALFATSAGAAVGSIISSFKIEGYNTFTGVYRDDSYVYSLSYLGGYEEPPRGYIFKYSPGGAFISSVGPFDAGPIGADRCHLGMGYISFADDYYSDVRFVNKNTGALAGSFNKGDGYDLVWDGTYYWTVDCMRPGWFYCYSTAGSLVRTWFAPGWPNTNWHYPCGMAYTTNAVDHHGRFFVLGSHSYNAGYILNANNGSLVVSFNLPPYTYAHTACYGKASPASYGGAYWMAATGSGGAAYAFQVDVDAHSAPAVLPSSLGKVKAVFR